MKFILGTVSVILILTVSCYGRLSLSPLFSDDMVLQRNATATIWGTATPGESVKASGSWGEVTETVVPASGNWSLQIPTAEAGETHTLKIQSGESIVVISGVLFGEVWVCSGQSNMAMSLGGKDPILNREEVLAGAEYPDIRLFRIRSMTKPKPSKFISREYGGGQWKICNPENAKSFSGVAYFFAKKLHQELGVPIGLVTTSWGSTGAESWLKLEALHTVTGYENFDENDIKGHAPDKKTPTVLFNGMINPLVPYTVKGVIWYQGESNTKNPKNYNALFTTLIESWRREWNIGLFPFYFVQIAPYRYGSDVDAAQIREAQRQALSIPNTGMVVTLDIGEADNIHPSNKRDVGARLANVALAKTYSHKGVSYSGPVCTDAVFKGAEVRLSFDYCKTGLILTSTVGFELAGADGEFHPATPQVKGNDLVLTSDKVEDPRQARYAWSNAPTASLFNGEGLPASPFKTEL